MLFAFIKAQKVSKAVNCGRGGGGNQSSAAGTCRYGGVGECSPEMFEIQRLGNATFIDISSKC